MKTILRKGAGKKKPRRIDSILDDGRSALLGAKKRRMESVVHRNSPRRARDLDKKLWLPPPYLALPTITPRASKKDSNAVSNRVYIVEHLLSVLDDDQDPQNYIEQWSPVPWTKDDQEKIGRVQGRAAEVLRKLGILKEDEKVGIVTRKPPQRDPSLQERDLIAPVVFNVRIPLERYRLAARVLLTVSAEPHRFQSTARIVNLVKQVRQEKEGKT